MKVALVEDQYAKNKDLKKEDVEKLQDWLKSQPHFPPISELELIIFLHSCYQSNEATKTCIDNYYTTRTHCPEFFAERDPDSKTNQESYKVACISLLPKTTPEGYKVFFNRLINTDSSAFNLDNLLKVFDMLRSLDQQEDGIANGVIIIIDLHGATLSHIMKISIMTVKKTMFFLQEAMPVRLKGFHFANAPSFMDKIMSLIKPFIKKELLNMLHIHQSNSDSIFKLIPKDCLPAEIGGTLGNCLDFHKTTIERLLKNKEFFLEEEKLVINEKLRPGKPKNAGDLFGVEGTFKKLDID